MGRKKPGALPRRQVGTKTDECKVQNAKSKSQKGRIETMAKGHTVILQFAFCNLTFAFLSS
jgi:hypothetical protein